MRDIFGSYRGMKREGDSEDIINRVSNLCEELIVIYRSTKSAAQMADAYEDTINAHGFVFLGRGQNRVCFQSEGSAYVYKVPFRDTGLRDNRIARHVSSCVSQDANVYKEIGDHLPMVTDFVLADGYEDFCICAEFIEDMVTDGHDVGSQEEKAIAAIMENFDIACEMLRKVNVYFHLSDVHLVSGANNFGVKNGKMAIRDVGYLVPRIGEFKDLTSDKDGVWCSYEYYTFDNIKLPPHVKSLKDRIEFYSDFSEHWYPVDEHGNSLLESENDLMDGTDCMNNLLGRYEQTL